MTSTLRSDVVGSLLRPAYLLDARARIERGELSPPDFKRIEDRAVDEAVALQEAAGLDVVTDGEMRRYAFFGHLVEALEGSTSSPAGRSRSATSTARGRARAPGRRREAALAPADERRGVHLPARPDDAAGQGDAAQRAAGRRLLRPRQVTRRLRHARRLSRRPGRLHPARDCRAAPARLRVRPDRRAAVRRRCSTRPSAKATASAAAIPTRCSTPASSSTTPSSPATRASRSASTSAAATTRACSTRRAATIGSRSRCSSARAFDRFLLEYDDARSGTFEPLRYVPDDRIVVLGLVSSKTPRTGIGGRAARRASRRPRGSCRSSGWPSARSAASPRRTKATRCRRRTSGRSSSWSPRSRGTFGAERGIRVRRLRTALSDRRASPRRTRSSPG